RGHKGDRHRLFRIVRQLEIDQRADREYSTVGHQEGVAVGRRCCQRGGADSGICAWPVLDHDRLAEPLLKPPRDDTRERVRQPPAGFGTMILIAWVGYRSWAWAAHEPRGQPSEATTARVARSEMVFIATSFKPIKACHCTMERLCYRSELLFFSIDIVFMNAPPAVNRAELVSRRLKLRQLEVLLAVARSGSMAKAAEALAITQPVVSKSIADLEATLGVRLLDRTTRGIDLTLFGRALLERSVAIFNDLKTSVNELDFLADGTGGHLRIGSSDTIAFGMLGAILDRLSRRYPRLDFEAIAGLPHEDLVTRKIDLVIGRLPSVIPNDINVSILYDEEAYI